MSVAIGAVEPRLEARANVFLAATLVTDQAMKAVRVRNISQRGALIDGADIPGTSATVSLLRGSLRVSAKIAWRDRGLCGLHFETEVEVQDWVRKVGHSGQQRVDEMISRIRRPSPANPVLTSQPEQESLADLSTELGALCEAFAGIPDLIAKCPSELLQLESIAQRLSRLVKAS